MSYLANTLATLRTRCGCERQLVLDGKPREMVDVPLLQRWNLRDTPDTPLQPFARRRFCFVQSFITPTGSWEALYEEIE